MHYPIFPSSVQVDLVLVAKPPFIFMCMRKGHRR